MSIHDSSRGEKTAEGVSVKIRERLAAFAFAGSCARVRADEGSGMADSGSTFSSRRLLDAPDCFSE